MLFVPPYNIIGMQGARNDTVAGLHISLSAGMYMAYIPM